MPHCGEASNLGAAWRIRILQARAGSWSDDPNCVSYLEAGCEYFEQLPSVVLPSAKITRVMLHPRESETGGECSASVKSTRKSKGTHLLSVLTSLLSSRENWYEIKTINTPEDFAWITLIA